MPVLFASSSLTHLPSSGTRGDLQTVFAAPGTVACQAPRSMGFSRKEYWNGLPFPTPGDLPDSGIEPVSCIGRWVLYHCAT